MEHSTLCCPLRIREPTLPLVSNVTGTWLSADQARDPEYWVRHLRETVRFSLGVDVTESEVDTAITVVRQAVERMRQLAAFD